jgi:hypothetical protein
MRRQSAFIVAVALLCAGNVLAQTPAQLPKVSIELMPGVPFEKVFGGYALYGSFGAYGGILQRASSPTLPIQAVIDGKPARRVKIFIGAPGCKMATFDISVQEFAETRESFFCSPVPTMTLVGQIRPTELLRNQDATVSADYLAGWACGFFGFADCMVPQISFGSAKPDTQGIFKFELPDFIADSVTSESGLGAELQLILRDGKTYNVLAFLQPGPEALRTASGTLRISSFYSQNLAFVERNRAK